MFVLSPWRRLNHPLVSILLSSYTYGRCVDTTLESLRSQIYGLFEATVCDDGSADDSVSRIKRFTRWDGRFRLLMQPNSGQAGRSMPRWPRLQDR